MLGIVLADLTDFVLWYICKESENEKRNLFGMVIVFMYYHTPLDNFICEMSTSLKFFNPWNHLILFQNLSLSWVKWEFRVNQMINFLIFINQLKMEDWFCLSLPYNRLSLQNLTCYLGKSVNLFEMR